MPPVPAISSDTASQSKQAVFTPVSARPPVLSSETLSEPPHQSPHRTQIPLRPANHRLRVEPKLPGRLQLVEGGGLSPRLDTVARAANELADLVLPVQPISTQLCVEVGHLKPVEGGGLNLRLDRVVDHVEAEIEHLSLLFNVFNVFNHFIQDIVLLYPGLIGRGSLLEAQEPTLHTILSFALWIFVFIGSVG